MIENACTVVVADANVLINLIHVGRLDLCGQLPGLEFVIPDHVDNEITYPEQRAALDSAIEAGHFRTAHITDPADIAAFVELTRHLGRGEAACLILASRNGWSIACDETGRFRREALGRLDEDRLFGTIEIFVRSLRAGLLTVEEADADKDALEQRRFRMAFESFREVLNDDTGGEVGL